MDDTTPRVKFRHIRLKSGTVVLEIRLHENIHWTFHSMSHTSKTNDLSVFMPDDKETEELLKNVQSERVE